MDPDDPNIDWTWTKTNGRNEHARTEAGLPFDEWGLPVRDAASEYVFFVDIVPNSSRKQSLHAMATKKTANKCDILLTCVVMQDRHTHVAKRLLCGYEDKIVVEATSKKWFLKMARATAIGWHSPQSMAPPALQVPRSQPVKSCAIGHRANGGVWPEILESPRFFSNLREIVGYQKMPLHFQSIQIFWTTYKGDLPQFCTYICYIWLYVY